MADFAALRAQWEEVLGRRGPLREALGFWTAILDGWAAWTPADLRPLGWDPEECRERWERSLPLLAEAQPAIPPESIEDLVGPMMERLAVARREEAEGLERFAEAWDRGEVGPLTLSPLSGKEGGAILRDRLGLGSHVIGFLAHAGLRPPLETFFEGARSLPEGVWTVGLCPWCGGLPAYGDVVDDGRRRLSCHLCGGSWIAPRLKCPFCESWNSRDLVRLVAEGMEEGYFIEACRACHGYLKGVDRRQRWNAGSPLVEDWGSPHLDLYAVRDGYWRATPSLAHLLPAAP